MPSALGELRIFLVETALAQIQTVHLALRSCAFEAANEKPSTVMAIYQL